MAAPLTLAGTTAEQQIFEYCTKLKQLIADYKTANPDASTGVLAVAETLRLDAGSATYTVTIPVGRSADTDGGFSVDAIETLV